MTAPQPTPPVTTPTPDSDEINLLELLDVLLDRRWLIAGAVAVTVVLGAVYAFLLATPIYRSDMLVQVEDSKGDLMGGLLGEASTMFNIASPATAEIELLRSRLVVEQAVKDVRLDIKATPRYLPLIGRWLARDATEPSTPGILGMGGFVSGNESLEVNAFEVPDALENEKFRIQLTAGQGYELIHPDGNVLGQGHIGQALEFSTSDGPGRLLITSSIGLPGARFNLIRFPTLEKTEDIQKQLGISEKGKQSGVIAVTLEGKDPKELAALLQRIGKLYVAQNVERKAAEAEKTLGFLGTFLPQLRQQLEDSEVKFNAFRNKNSTFNLGEEGKLILEHSVDLQTKLLGLEQKRKELRALYTPEHYTVQTIDAQIGSIKSELTEMEHRVRQMPNLEQDLLRLTRDVKVNSDLYVSLLNSAQQLRLVKEGKVGNVRIVDTAREPREPVKPLRALVIALAGVLGLILGIALALLHKRLHPSLSHPDEIEQKTGLRVLATVPYSAKQAQDASSHTARHHILALSAPTDPAVESFRSLRTALQFAMLDVRNNVLLITGPTPGVGKSFVSANLATVLGANDKRVLLIDADLRKGHLNHRFGVSRNKGLSELLNGSLKLPDVLRQQVAPNVDLITTGVMPSNPGELLAAPGSHTLLEELAPQYDHVIIDTPPVLVASDTAAIVSIAGAVLLVARAGETSLGELQETAKRLRQQTNIEVNGVIFNGLDLTKRRYGSSYTSYRYTQYEY